MTINSGDPADNGNGTKKESKYALATSFVLSVLATGAVDWLTDLDLNGLPGWATGAATLAVTTGIAYLVAFKTKNAPALPAGYTRS